MTVDEVVRQLAVWRERHTRIAWRPKTHWTTRKPRVRSQFGGVPYLLTGERWPQCGACKRDMSFFLQLDLETLPPELQRSPGQGLLQFFYCTVIECESQRHAWEPFSAGQLLRIVSPIAGPGPSPGSSECELFPARKIVGWKPADDLPQGEEHDALGLHFSYDFREDTVCIVCDDPALEFGPLPSDETNEADQEVAEAIGDCLTGDKLGGWPCWVQGVEYPNCPQCGACMDFLFQIDSEDNIPFMLGDAGCGHITQCPNHPQVLAFGWACS